VLVLARFGDAVKASISRLHEVVIEVAPADLLSVATTLRDRGSIRHYGVSNFDSADLDAHMGEYSDAIIRFHAAIIATADRPAADLDALARVIEGITIRPTFALNFSSISIGRCLMM
jgi:aryl-alcohol dehydrogenase-like predicted oxidoreductase